MLKSLKQVNNLSKKYKIPAEDIILIALNCCGLKVETKEKRLRFKLRLNTSLEVFYLAVCVNTSETPFILRDGVIFLNQEEIGRAYDWENDTCDATYFRRNKTVLNINSNCRSDCRGCRFCGTYSQDAEDKIPLLQTKELSEYLSNIFGQQQISRLTDLKEIAICTGCFKTEREALDHLLMINDYCRQQNIRPNIKYIGMQLQSLDVLKEIRNDLSSFSYYLTLECFSRRRKLLRPSKAQIDLIQATGILDRARANNIKTTFLYILGLDSLRVIKKNFKRLAPHINCFPVINLMQNFVPEQNDLRHRQAHRIEYYLKARKTFEEIFKAQSFRPIPWENYRGLWYLQFDDEIIDDIRI